MKLNSINIMTLKKNIYLFFVSLLSLISAPVLGFVYFVERFDSATGNFWEGILDFVVLSSVFIVVPVVSIVCLIIAGMKIAKFRKEGKNLL